MVAVFCMWGTTAVRPTASLLVLIPTSTNIQRKNSVTSGNANFAHDASNGVMSYPPQIHRRVGGGLLHRCRYHPPTHPRHRHLHLCHSSLMSSARLQQGGAASSSTREIQVTCSATTCQSGTCLVGPTLAVVVLSLRPVCVTRFGWVGWAKEVTQIAERTRRR